MARTSRSAWLGWVRRWQSEWGQTISRRAKVGETTTPLSIVGRHPRSKVGGCLVPSRACGRARACATDLEGALLYSVPEQVGDLLLLGFATLFLTSGGVRICRSGSLLAALSRQCLPRRDGPANLEAPWAIVAPDRVYGARNLVSRFFLKGRAPGCGLMGADGE